VISQPSCRRAGRCDSLDRSLEDAARVAEAAYGLTETRPFLGTAAG
jgi:hypothetical protein